MHSSRTALDALAPLADSNPGNVGWRKRLSEGYSQLGHLALARGRPDEAATAFRQAVARQQQVVALLPKDRLWITIHTSDDEAAAIWRRVTGFGDERVIRLGDADNFWQVGDTGRLRRLPLR